MGLNKTIHLANNLEKELSTKFNNYNVFKYYNNHYLDLIKTSYKFIVQNRDSFDFKLDFYKIDFIKTFHYFDIKNILKILINLNDKISCIELDTDFITKIYIWLSKREFEFKIIIDLNYFDNFVVEIYNNDKESQLNFKYNNLLKFEEYLTNI